MRVVDFYPYIHGEGNYATFQFFYRSQGESTHIVGISVCPDDIQ